MGGNSNKSTRGGRIMPRKTATLRTEVLEQTITLTAQNSDNLKVSCEIPVAMSEWNMIKEIANQKGTSARTLIVKAIGRIIREHMLQESLSGIIIGNRVFAMTYNGEEYSGYLVIRKKDELGIVIRQPTETFVPLANFKIIELMEY